MIIFLLELPIIILPGQKFILSNAELQVSPKWVFSGGVRFGVSDYAYLPYRLINHFREVSVKPLRVCCME